MSLSNVSTATRANPNHPANQPAPTIHPKTSKPSVQNTHTPLSPTESAQASQNTGDHMTVQQEQGKADLSNPLTPSSSFNTQVATSRI